VNILCSKFLVGLFSGLILALTTVSGLSYSLIWLEIPEDGDMDNSNNWRNWKYGPGGFVFRTSEVTHLYNLGDFSSITFDPGASAYTISGAIFGEEITEPGITNNSGVTQTFTFDSTFVAYFVEGNATTGTNTLFDLPDFTGIYFSGTSNAGQTTFSCDGFSDVWFSSSANADRSVILCGDVGRAYFLDSSSAANATIVSTGDQGTNSGNVRFEGDSDGDRATIKLYNPAILEVEDHNPPGVRVGSVEGDGFIRLGKTANKPIDLAIGHNNASTTFDGIISGHGTISKTGKGTLALTNANRYFGGTVIDGGTLVINSLGASGTGTGRVNVRSGALAGAGIIAGSVTIGTGRAIAATLAPGNEVTGTLTILSDLRFESDGIYQWDSDATQSTADEVVANGVRIDNSASFTPRSISEGSLLPGTIFTVISNTGANPITGTFSNLADGGTITVGSNTFQANYEGGDGNDLTLTVVP
jgi:autotransporter-associated beta strand protein